MNLCMNQKNNVFCNCAYYYDTINAITMILLHTTICFKIL